MSLTRLPLTLCKTEPDATPCGLVVARSAASALVDRLAERLEHYRALRLAITDDFLILLSTDTTSLPWSSDTLHILRQDGPFHLPVDHALAVPRALHEGLAMRIARELNLAMPLLLLPHGSSVRVVGLVRARPLSEIDLAALAIRLAA